MHNLDSIARLMLSLLQDLSAFGVELFLKCSTLEDEAGQPVVFKLYSSSSLDLSTSTLTLLDIYTIKMPNIAEMTKIVVPLKEGVSSDQIIVGVHLGQVAFSGSLELACIAIMLINLPI